MEKIHASVILEMIGRPADYIKEAMGKIIESMNNSKIIEVLDKKIAEPKKIEEVEQDMYSTFAEIEVKVNTLHDLFLLVFTYMPSHVEVISPAELKFKNIEINGTINELAIKLHQYDEIAKRLGIEIRILQNQLAKLKQEAGTKEADGKKIQKKALISEIKKSREKKETKAKTKSPRERKKRAKKR